MSTTRILADLGLLAAEDGPETDRMVSKYLELFLRAGGRFSWSEWAALSVDHRAMLAELGDRIAVDRITAILREIQAEAGEETLSRELEKAAEALLK